VDPSTNPTITFSRMDNETLITVRNTEILKIDVVLCQSVETGLSRDHFCELPPSHFLRSLILAFSQFLCSLIRALSQCLGLSDRRVPSISEFSDSQITSIPELPDPRAIAVLIPPDLRLASISGLTDPRIA
jgi:hypothetical protein